MNHGGTKMFTQSPEYKHLLVVSKLSETAFNKLIWEDLKERNLSVLNEKSILVSARRVVKQLG
jgi:hypothetical protein